MARLILVYLLSLPSLVFWSWFAASAGAAQPKAVAVLYPDLQEPYRGVVTSILEGIQEEARAPLRLIPIREDNKAAQSKDAINRDQVAAIIALGKTGLAAAQPWRGEIPIVAGALVLALGDQESGVTGISLAVDPGVFFEYLAQVAPSVKRVHVVYNPATSDWLIRYAHSLANARNFQLIDYSSGDIKTSALLYRDILKKSRPGEDAIWLLSDPGTLDEQVILPMLLRVAWDQSTFLFSGNPAHVKRGALFALFPDNKAMGKSLARMAQPYASGAEQSAKDGVVPLRDLQAAINLRAAEHGGLAVSERQLRKFSLIFPTP